MEFFGGFLTCAFLVFIGYKIKASRDEKSAYDVSGLGGGDRPDKKQERL